MEKYVYDGRWLKNAAGHRQGEVDREFIRAVNGALLGEIQGKYILNAHHKKVLAFDGTNVLDDRGKKQTTIDEIKKLIAGEEEDEILLVALWYFLVKK